MCKCGVISNFGSAYISRQKYASSNNHNDDDIPSPAGDTIATNGIIQHRHATVDKYKEHLNNISGGHGKIIPTNRNIEKRPYKHIKISDSNIHADTERAYKEAKITGNINKYKKARELEEELKEEEENQEERQLASDFTKI